MQEAATAEIIFRWNKFRERESVLRKRVVLLKLRESLSKSCMRSVLYVMMRSAKSWKKKKKEGERQKRRIH